jgi:hypothetical protein
VFNRFTLKSVAFLVLTVPVFAFTVGPARADLYGLVIGINAYEHEPPLDGAVADARDIAGALGKLSPVQVVVLTDAEATKARITREWRRLLNLARPGDTIVLTYAGHGSQEADQPPLDEADGLDESFLLGAFNRDETKPGYSERLPDDMFHEWFRVAAEKDVRVVFLADACHSGSMTRSMQGPDQPAKRSVPAYGLGDMPDLEGPSADTSALNDEELPRNVVFFSATQADRTAPEVTIDGERRDALSYAFARALEGAADLNGDRALTWLEIKPFIARMVRQLSEAQHYANAAYRGENRSAPLFTGLPAADPFDKSEASAVTLKIANLPREKANLLERHLDGVTLVRDQMPADLTWDAEAQTVFNDVGDAVAHDIGSASLQSVIDKWRVLPAINKMYVEAPLDMSLEPSDERHAEDAIIRFSSEPIAHTHVAVFNLAPDGRIQFLYPMPELGDATGWTEGTRWQLRLKVIPPFGADHLVVVASESPLAELRKRLRGAYARNLPKLLEHHLGGISHQIGIHGLYTASEEG